MPLLERTILNFEPVHVSRMAMLDLNKFEHAYITLGGPWPVAVSQHVDKVKARCERHASEEFARPKAAVKISRYVPCPCGSGKKFKKCCQGTARL